MTKEIRNDNPNRKNTEPHKKETAGTHTDNRDGMSKLMAKRRISGVDRIGQGDQD